MKFNSMNASTVGWVKMPQPPLFIMGATNGEQEFKAGCATHRTLKTMSDCPHHFQHASPEDFSLCLSL